MKISAIASISQKQQRPAFKSILIENLNPKHSSKRSEILSETEKFSNNPYSLIKIGEGVNGETYKCSGRLLNNVVIKRPKEGVKEDYRTEYEHLMKIPVDKIGGQEAVARVYDTKKENYYLLSTLVQGKQISDTNPLTTEHLKSLFNKMFELDKNGIYHGDLNGKNILLNNDGSVNFLDYQWTEFVSKTNFFDHIKTEQVIQPIDAFVENAQMFEMATAPWYIDNLSWSSDKVAFLKEYLQAKSTYHSKRADYVEQLLPTWNYSGEKQYIKKCIQNEKAKSAVYKNPSDDVLRLEMKKIQFLSDYRDAYQHVDPHCLDRNILASPSAYLCAISAIQDFKKDIYKELLVATDADYKTYLHSLEDYGQYWYKNLVDYCSDTFDYIMRATQKKGFSYETPHNFYANDRNPRIFLPNRDILESLPYKYNTHYDKSFNISDNVLQELQTNLSIPALVLSTELFDSKSKHNIQKISNLYKKSNEFVRSEQTLDLLNASNLTVLKVREFNSYVKHNASSYIAQITLENMLEQSVDFAQTLFDNIFSSLKDFGSQFITVRGYKNMRKFIPKI